MGDYHDLYLKSDVALLADVFVEFRSICINNYKLDPFQYYTAPGLSWDAALMPSQQRLELLTDENMHLMVEKGFRGGISQFSQRHAKDDGDNKNILYLDANNLNGWVMSQPLPTGGFNWLTEDEITNFGKIKKGDGVGFILD